MSVGADSTIAPVFAAGVAAVAAVGTPAYAHLVSLTALMVGALLVVAGLLRLGWIADFFPQPVVTGVLTGIGIEILVKQLPTVLGLPGGGTTTIGRLQHVVDQISKFNGWTFGIALAVLAIVIVSEQVDHRIPGALIGVVGATAVVAAAGLTSHGVKVVGSIQTGLPSFGLPSANGHQVGQLLAMVVTVAFLCIVQTSATARSTGVADTKPGDFNTDLVAVGAGSLLSGFAGSFAVDASPPRTAVVGSAGGKSQTASLVAVAAVVAVLAFATGLLKDLPEATLGAILIFVASRLFHVQELRRILRFGWFEFGLLLITVVVVVFVGVEQGVVAAALLALAQRTRLAARPQFAVLGREPGTDHWIETDIGRTTEQVPGVLVYLLYAPIWYANASHVVERIGEAIASAPETVRVLVLDANAMSDVDYTGAKELAGLLAKLDKSGVTVGFARSSHMVHHDLKRAGLLETIGSNRLFASVEEAVRSLAHPLEGSGTA
jgi:MFS superfamily sulfate permease-like transporter